MERLYVDWSLIDLDWPIVDLVGFDFDFKLLEISQNLLSLRSLCRFLLACSCNVTMILSPYADIH